MARFFRGLWRILKGLPLAVLGPFFLLFDALILALTDLVALVLPKRASRDTLPATNAASIVIPNWNGRDLLEKYLPSVVNSIAGLPGSEVIVVDNASEDGSAEFMREKFPSVRVLAQTRNLGFGGGSNAGFAAAKNDIVVLLNSDMRVEPDFLAPLLEGFTDEKVFAVSCQIFMEQKKVREETGLTEAAWLQGALRVRHRDDKKVDTLFRVSTAAAAPARSIGANSRSWGIRSSLRAVLSGRHRPRVSGLEAWVEGSLSTRAESVKASRNDW